VQMNGASAIGVALLAGLALATAGCGGGRRQEIPDVRGERLDVAQGRLDALDLRYETVGGGTFGVVVRSHWTVCRQEPKPGVVASSVRLIVDRWCPSPPPPQTDIVPNVTGERLDVAEDELERLGFRFEAYANDAEPIVVPANWTVCDQYPAGGDEGRVVELYAEHVCD
jgi:beta-lactam-binding protein with PASTA domain